MAARAKLKLNSPNRLPETKADIFIDYHKIFDTLIENSEKENENLDILTHFLRKDESSGH